MKVWLVSVGVAMLLCAGFAAESAAQSGRTGPVDSEPRSKVWRCPSFVVFRGKSTYGGKLVYRARKVRRSPHVRCAKVRKLLKATYGQGPLKPIRTQFKGQDRPVTWL